jgi:hypothetical protein
VVPVAGLQLRASGLIPGLPALQPSALEFSEPGGTDPGPRLPGMPLHGLLGEHPTEVDCHVSAQGITVRASSFGQVWISADGRHLRWRPEDAQARQRPELVLGPGLVLALALQDVFCLHASAILTPAGAVVFAGPSGAGKSMLAARILAEGEFTRLADDIAPIQVDDSGCSILPHFPQLKLPPEQQYPPDGLYLLEPGDQVSEEPLSPAAAALAVCGQVVASRLLPEPVLTRLLQVCATVTERAQVRRLRYPHRPEAIADVARILGS